MQLWAKSSIAASVLLAGCSLFSQEQTETTASNVNREPLQIPAGLQAPAKPGRYDIPVSNATAQEVDTHSPTLVLATASSSRIEEGEQSARVWFDRNDYTGDLLPFLQQTVEAWFQQQGIELNVDDNPLIYTTGWITRNEESGFWFWAEDSAIERARFNIIFEPKPHGRSTSLTVKMFEHEHYTPESALTTQAKKRQEVALLNSIIDRVAIEEYKIALQNKSKAPDIALEPGMDKNGNPALLTPQSIDVTWSQLELLFAQLGMEVTDMNRSQFTYYVSYEKPEQGIWDKMWGKEPAPQLPIANGDYQLVLTRADNGTAIILQDKEGKQLSPETVLALHEPFVKASRLAKVEL